MSVSLGQLAVRFGCELRGDPDTRIDGVAPLGAGREHTLSFLANPRYARALATTRAAAVVLDCASAASSPVPCLVNDNPYATYARIAAYLFAPPPVTPGIHSSAVVDREARVDPTAHVGANAVIEAGAQIGARSFIGPHCFVASDVIVGEEVRLVAHVCLGERVTLGSRIIIHPGAVLGADGFGFAPDRGVFVKVPQLGGVRIGDDVEIGANTTIDRGALGDTIVEEGVKLDNLIQIAHNARIGAHTVIAASTGVSGSVSIGQRCMIGGAVGFAGHISICDDVSIAGYSVITHTIKRPGVYSGLIPAEEVSTWRRIVARLKRIELLAARVTAVEKKLNMRASAAQSEDEDDD
jgi:UDP-3-O-[3-hydroxymyristoyl] glucosamine N-acyltransferase